MANPRWRDGAPDSVTPGQGPSGEGTPTGAAPTGAGRPSDGIPGGGPEDRPAGRPVRTPGRAERFATYAVLFLLGAILGVIGAFLVPLRIGRQVAPISVVLAVIGNLAVGIFGARGTGSRLGAVAPGVGWLLVAFALGVKRPEGDVIVPGGGVGVAFTLGGTLAAAIAIGIVGPGTRDRRRPGPP